MWQDWGDTDQEPEEEPVRISLEGLWQKVARQLARLVEQSPHGTLGRTAIVKLLYLVQEVRAVPLGYDFRLYTYGPFASEVLDNLGTAQSFQSIHIKTILYPSGYGYEVRAGSKAETVKECVADWLASHESALTWAVENFGGRSASELEIIATIVYVADTIFPSERALHCSGPGPACPRGQASLRRAVCPG